MKVEKEKTKLVPPWSRAGSSAAPLSYFKSHTMPHTTRRNGRRRPGASPAPAVCLPRTAQAGRGLWVEGTNKPNFLFPSYFFFSWFKSEEIKETPDLIVKDSWICGNMECVVGELLRYIKLIVRKVDVLQSCEMRKVSRNFAREFVVS